VPDAKAQTPVEIGLDRKILLMAAGLCALVAVTAYVCIVFPRDQGRIAPIWLANAWIVATLLRSRMARWPLFAGFALAGDVAANLMAGDAPLIVFGLGACNLLECLVCAWLVRRRCGEDFDISRVGHLLTFILGAVAGSICSASAAATLLGVVDHTDIPRGLAVWVEADALGLLTLTPALLVATQKDRAPIVWREGWTLAVLACVAAAVFFLAHTPLLFVISAILILPTWRMGLPGAVAGFAIIAALGTLAAFTSHGPIMTAEPANRIIGLQVFLTVAFLTSVPVAVARDAGEKLKARLRTALAEAEQAAVVKSEFLANMSHELRTPLTSVVGFTRLAADQPDLSPLSRDYIDRVGEASRALLCAVNDILDFSKLEAGQVSFRPEPVAVHELLLRALDLFTPQAAAKDLALSLDDATPAGLTVAIDPDRLRQVLLNLVGNAVKFTSEGHVTLSAAYDEASARLTLAVIDTGPGVPPDRLDRLFKRFSQVDGALNRSHGGTGLGLAICKGIVEAMGGDVGATSVVGQGSRFFMTVPAPRAQSAPVELAAEIEPEARAGLKVLVTDDHPANRELVRLFLAGIGAEIAEAGDGEQAVEAAASQAFDVILMDLRMPRLDGIGAVTRIRAAAGPNQTTPILAFTADAESAFDDRLRALGFDGAVAKPVEPGQLISAILTAVGGAEAGDESESAAGQAGR
jgi:signal transduction histidine kinase/ActR/RegA family two-component response regulator